MSFVVETRLAMPRLKLQVAAAATAPIKPTPTLSEQYLQVDAAMGELEGAMTRATHDVGTRAPVLQTTRRNVDLAAVGAGIVVAGLSASLGWTGPAGWESSIFSALCGLGAGLLTASFTPTIAQVIAPFVARRPLSGSRLDGLRSIARRDHQSAEAAGLATAARKWLGKLDDREVHGWEARDILSKLTKSDQSQPEQQARIARWAELRDAIVTIESRPNASLCEAGDVLRAFEKLTLEEKRALGPLVLEKLYEGEVPRYDNLSFDYTNRLYAEIHRAALGLPQPPERNDADDPLQNVAVYEIGVPQEAYGPIEPSDAIATLVELRQRFDDCTDLIRQEAKSRPKGRSTLKKPNHSYAGVNGPLLMRAIVLDPARTPLERFALGIKARGAWIEMYERHIHGFAANAVLEELMAAGKEAATPPVLDRLARIDAFFAELDSKKPDLRFERTDTESVLESIRMLLPCDRAAAAKLALDRFFTNEAPRGHSPYRIAQPFADALRAF